MGKSKKIQKLARAGFQPKTRGEPAGTRIKRWKKKKKGLSREPKLKGGTKRGQGSIGWGYLKDTKKKSDGRHKAEQVR